MSRREFHFHVVSFKKKLLLRDLARICDSDANTSSFSRYQLAVVNQHVDASCSNLIPGESLCLAQNSAEDCTTTYIVRSGDTCAGIASKAGLNTTLLYLNNPQIDEKCSNIYNNEVRIFIYFCW